MNSSLGAKSMNVTSEFESIIQLNGQSIEIYLFAVISVHENIVKELKHYMKRA